MTGSPSRTAWRRSAAARTDYQQLPEHAAGACLESLSPGLQRRSQLDVTPLNLDRVLGRPSARAADERRRRRGDVKIRTSLREALTDAEPARQSPARTQLAHLAHHPARHHGRAAHRRGGLKPSSKSPAASRHPANLPRVHWHHWQTWRQEPSRGGAGRLSGHAGRLLGRAGPR